MSSTGTTTPGKMWVSSQPPTFTAQMPEAKKSNMVEDQSFAVGYDIEKPGGKIFSEKTLNTYKKKQKPGILKTQNTDKYPVRFQDEENSSREIVTAHAAGVTFSTSKPYHAVIAERDALLESEGAYRRRIQQLEEDHSRILLDYDGLYKENNILRDKLDKGDDKHVESYQRIYDDRKILREAETAYKRRINQLESDAKDMLKNFESLYSENKVLREKARKLEDRLNVIDRLDDIKKIHELEKKLKLLEQTVRTMGYERQDLVKENNEIENQMYKLREEISDLNKKNLLLERENEGFKKGFMALGQNMDTALKDELKQKTRRQQEEERLLKEEHSLFKKENANLKSELHKLEKINIELYTRNEILERDKQLFEVRLLDLAKAKSKGTPPDKHSDAEENKIKQQTEELLRTVDKLKIDNTELKTRNEMLIEEKKSISEQLINNAKNQRETASSIRRKVEMERDMRDLTIHVENFKQKVKRLEAENVDLKNELMKLETETKAQKQALKVFDSNQVRQSDVQLKDLNEKLISLNQEIKRLTEENLQLKAENNSLEDKLTQQIETVTKAKEALQVDKEFLESELQQTNKSTAEKLSDLQDELNAAQVDLKLLKVNFQNANVSLQETKNENKGLINQLEEKRTELDNLKDTIRNNRDVYLELSNANRENATLKREIEELNSKRKGDALKQEVELEELLKNQEFMNSALSDHKVRLDVLQQEKNDLKKENLELVKANERQAKTIASLEIDLKSVQEDGFSKIKTLQDELNQVQKDFRKADEELTKARQEIEITKNERENQVKRLMSQMNKLKIERENETQQLKHQSDSLRREVARLKIFEERIENMETNLKELVNRLKETEERNKQITNNKLASLQQVVSEMKSENLANRIRAAEKEQNEIEKHKLELEIKQDAINEIRKLKLENDRLLALIEDKRTAEEAKDEWNRKKNKFNEIVSQNKRLQDENKRVLDLFENSRLEHMKKDLPMKSEQMKTVESKFDGYKNQIELLKKVIEEKEVELRKTGAMAERARRLQHENNKLKAENKKMSEEGTKIANQIRRLQELEVIEAKYIDSTANNQRLYEENMRLRETIEDSRHQNYEINRTKPVERNVTSHQEKYIEENILLKSTLQIKETELRRELELQKDRASNLEVRNKRLIEEMTKHKLDLSKKDNIIIKLRELESSGVKLKDANTHANRLYEENQRLRNLLENANSGWNINFQNAKKLSSNAFKEYSVAPAMHVDSNKSPKTVGQLKHYSNVYRKRMLIQ